MNTCDVCDASFEVESDEIDFLERMKFSFGNTMVEIPAPELCPNCRQTTRTAHRNEQNLYHGKSDLSGQSLITIHSENAPWGAPYKIYSQEEWHGDSWDPLAYGREFDFSRPFFEQFAELHKAVPRIALVTVDNENCPYTTGTGYCKNCHLINSSEYSEDCYYGKLLQKCKDSVDCSYLYNSELCYECFSCYDCYSCGYLTFSQNSNDCWFSENLVGCNNCLFCSNISRSEYCIFNEAVGKEQFKTAIGEILGSFSQFEAAKETFTRISRERVHKYANIVNSEGCVGDFITNSKHCLDCYDVNDSEDCRFVAVGVEAKDVYDSSNMYIKPELNYQMLGTIETFHCAFGIYIFHSRDVLYSEQIHNSHDLFGCVGLKRQEYCVFNKRYSKDEYELLVPRIIEHMKGTGEWGQFFPAHISPHGYNETLAYEYDPLSKDEALSRGWNWNDELSARVEEAAAFEIPDRISDVRDDICEQLLVCSESGRPFKVIPQELKFYHKQGIPIPRRAPAQRHEDRMKLRNPRTLWERSCEKCQTPLSSPYSPERPETIYCERCFAEEIS